MEDLLMQTVKKSLDKEVKISTTLAKISGKLKKYGTRLKDTPSGRQREIVYCLCVELFGYSCKDNNFKQKPGDIIYVPVHSLITIGFEK